MSRLRFVLAVLGTSLALVVAVGVVGVLTARDVLANAVIGTVAGPFAGHAGHPIPPELQGLVDLPPAERFAHFTGAQVTLKDANNQPLSIQATPGKVSAVSATSLTLAANDGSSKTFALDGNTVIRAKPDPNAQNAKPTPTTLKQGDLVVVITKNGEPLARAVMSGGTEGFGRPGGWGPWGGRGPWAPHR